MDLSAFIGRSVQVAWRLARGQTLTGYLVQPFGFSASRGLFIDPEVRTAIVCLRLALSARDLDLVNTQPGDVRILLRGSDLDAVVPAIGDIVALDNGEGYAVQGVEKVADGGLWALVCSAEDVSWDFGSISDGSPTAEDWGDLTTAGAVLTDLGALP
jgi:hypothetical protein